jgi:hypothetical protein
MVPGRGAYSLAREGGGERVPIPTWGHTLWYSIDIQHVIFLLLYYIFTFVVVLSTLVVESVRDLVSDDPADAAVVHVGRSVRLEKITLKTKKNCVSSNSNLPY